MKLIHSGKVLKDDQTIESCGIKQNDFLVVMVTKPKKPAAAAAPAPAPAGAATEAAKPPAAAPAAADKPAEAPAAPAPAAPALASSDLEFPAEIVNNLTAMGFPEAEVRHCLRAANGNPDVAVEFLTNGIPPGLQPGEQGAAAAAVAASSSSGGGGGTLSALRNHPQFNDLRRLVQSDPQMLQTVLTQIGQQQPDLLAEINANQEEFLRMMNEPITESSSSSSGGGSSSQPSLGGGSDGGAGLPPGMLEGMANPVQMAQLIQSMSPEELNQMAAMMGLSPDQLRVTAQMLGQIPPEQLQQYMMQAMGGAGGGGMMGGGGGGGPQVLRLTEEEMAAVDRLADMGFDRTEAAQAYLACDKNEALAANLLMDSMGDGGGFGFGGGGDSGGSGGNDDGDDDGDDNDGDDAMYD
jgi:UV excision repair protein RAD23